MNSLNNNLILSNILFLSLKIPFKVLEHYYFFISLVNFLFDNKKDLYDVPKKIIEDIEIITVKSVDEVLKIALIKELKPVEWIEVESLTKSKTGEKQTTGSTH